MSAEPGRPSLPRTATSWVFTQALQRTTLHWAARRGDLVARLQLDPALREDPYPSYELIRRDGAVTRGAVVWATVSHATATAVLRSADWSTASGHGELPPALRGLAVRSVDPWSRGPLDAPSMLAVDPPVHTRYRRLVNRAFTVRAAQSYEELVQQRADALLDDLERRAEDEADLVASYAARLPVGVIADILGVPEPMHDRLLTWGDGAALMLEPGLDWRRYRRAVADVQAMHAWFARHVAELRVRPGDDLLSRLAHLEDDALTDDELHAVGLLVLAAGFETTVNLIGNGVAALSAHPEQLAVLEREPEHWSNAVDEVLRFDPPVQETLRTAARATELGGREVRAGTVVLAMLAGANRDPQVFADPQRFDVRRANAGDHLAFSSGVHYCLGASLARREAVIGLRSLYARFPGLTTTGTPVRRGTRVLRGFDRLPVRLDRVREREPQPRPA